MALPSVADYGAIRCRATAKHSRCQCQKPAAFGMPVCRVHGARRRSTVKAGPDHPRYRHGKETLGARAERREAVMRLDQLEALARALGTITGPRRSGRKPG